MNRRGRTTSFPTACVLLLATAGVLPGSRAGAAAPPPAEAAPEPPDSRNSVSVFVPDSSAAVERLILAEKLEKASEWDKAAGIYQELLEKYGDRVVPTEATIGSTYISIPTHVLQRLARWPAEGLAVYNGLYQPAAEKLLQQASTEQELQAITDRYLFTRAGGVAAGRLMGLWWERGEVANVARLAARLASTLPVESPDRPQLLFQAALAWELAGQTERGAMLLAQLRKEHPQARGLVAGKDADLAESLQQVLGSSRRDKRDEVAWKAFGGSPDRAMVPTGGGRADALLFSVELNNPTRSEDPALPPLQNRMMLNQSLGIFPVYDNRQLFFQDGVNLYAVSIEAGTKLPGWPATSVPLVPSGTAQANTVALRTLAVTEDSLYAVNTDLTTMPWLGLEQTRPDAAGLISISRSTGVRQWTFNPASLDGQTPLKQTQLASPPLVVGDQIFVAARGGRNAQFQDVYLLCIARKTGSLLWSAYIASGPNLNMMLMDELPSQTEAAFPELSYDAGRVVVVTNVGVIAAVDATTGTPDWLHVYPRKRMPTQAELMRRLPLHRQRENSSARIFASSPAILQQGKIFALPVDARSLLVLDAADGSSLKEIPLESLQNPDTLSAVAGQKLVLSGERSATVLDWQKAGSSDDAQRDAIEWTMNLPGVRGRPFLTADSLFLATDERLLRISSRNWKIEQSTPRHPSVWDAPEGPGNLLVTDEHVVIATPRRINVYTNLSAATGRLDRDVAANPDSPEPLVRYAELMFAAGQYPVAQQKFEAAAAMLAAHPQIPAEIRGKLFSSALSCASRLGLSNEPDHPSRSDAFLAVAHSVAAAPAQWVQYELAAATIELRRNDGPRTLVHLQAILNDPKRRASLCRDADGQTRYAAQIARRQIAHLIDRYGSSVYQPTEQLATRQFATLQSAGNTAAMIELAQQYPNSTVAPSALLTAAGLQEEARDLPGAASTLRQLLQDYPNHPDTPAFVEAVARVYAAMPGKINVAAGRLAQAAASYPDACTRSPIQLPDGQVIQPSRFAEAARLLREIGTSQRASLLPDFRLPSPGQPLLGAAKPIADVSAAKLLSPATGQMPSYRHALAISPTGDLAVLNASGELLFRLPSPLTAAARDLAWASPNLVVVRAGRQLAAIDIARHNVAWSVDVEKLPTVEQAPDDADAAAPDEAQLSGQIPPQLRQAAALHIRRPRQVIRVLAGAVPEGVKEIVAEANEITSFAIAGNRVLLGTGNGRIAALDVATGKLLWQLRPDPGPVIRLLASDDFAATRHSTGGRNSIVGIDTDTGRMVFRRSFSPDHPIQNLALSDDGKLVFTLPNRLTCRDLFDQSDRTLFDFPVANNAPFAGQDGPDQLLITNDMIAAVTDGGMAVRLYSLFTGRPMLSANRQTGVSEPAIAFVPHGRPSIVHLTEAAPYLYAHTTSSIRALNLQQTDPAERRLPATVMNISTLIPGARHLVAIEPAPRVGNPPGVASLNLICFSRAPGKAGESGRLDHLWSLQPETPIVSWQLLETGLYTTTPAGQLLYYPTAP